MQTAAVKFKDSSSGGGLPVTQYNSEHSAEESYLYVEGSEYAANISEEGVLPQPRLQLAPTKRHLPADVTACFMGNYLLRNRPLDRIGVANYRECELHGLTQRIGVL